ncbi:centriolar and ciliogenesis-associated protein HYLS1 [Bombina bombina]|uniref:centriolar and ciliogenesis-associated protein HYLS1 n=1 Tax=Bombina bombina TaxID=8345 RepID=UPI00235AC480|nr:centriolar and ciliogenesis-associated protein HYLS1 [Bombina bombina]
MSKQERPQWLLGHPSDLSRSVDNFTFGIPTGDHSHETVNHSEHSCDTDPLTVSEEELRAELSLLGFADVPHHKLLEFKQDLERLMANGVRGSAVQRQADKTQSITLANPPPEPHSDWGRLSPWVSSSSAEWGDCHREQDTYCKHTVNVPTQVPGSQRPPTMTRKVLRRKNDGLTHVSDESFVYSETESMDGTTGTSSVGESQASSCFSSSPDCITSFIRPPTSSLLNNYRHRSDPVGRYQKYKQSWDALQGALVKERKEVCWKVKEQMMVLPPQAVPRSLPTPNLYVVPTDKKRYGLRWAIRRAMVNGVIPRGNCL